MLAARTSISLVTALAFVIATTVTPVAHAQTTSSSSSSSSPSVGTPWGTRMEHWLAAGLGIALGTASAAVGTGLQRYAVDVNTHALQPSTTQADAAASANTARDFLLAAQVMWAVGASLAAIGLTWVIVLSFSTPAPSAELAPAAATAPTAALHVTPLGLTLEGTF